MTPEELETYRLKAQMEALRLLVRGLYSGLANSSPATAAAFRARFQELRDSHAGVALKNIDPAYSDMLASEYQSALEDLLTFVEQGFAK